VQGHENIDYKEEFKFKTLSSRKFSRKSRLVNILLFSIISYFGAEIMTGSTSVEGILKYPISAMEGMIFYGFQVSIIADISIRHKLNLGTIYLIGLIYGILEEGFALFTMESTASHTLWLSLIGLNITWTIYIMLFHAVITVCSTIVIVHIISKDTLREPFLNASAYAIMVPSLGIIYYTFIQSSLMADRVPDLTSLLILLLVAMIILGVTVLNERNPILNNFTKLRWILGNNISLIIWAIVLGTPFIFGNRIPLLLIPITILLGISLVYFYLFFQYKLNFDMKKSKQSFLFYATFNTVLLVFGTFNRTIPSDLLAISGIMFLIYFGFKKIYS